MNIYIDCGVNKGNDVECFRRAHADEKWRIIGFEPAPFCIDYLKTKKDSSWWKGFEFHEAGVSDRNGKQTLHVGMHSVSSSLREDKKNGLSGKTVEVDVIDFAEFLDQFNKDDYIIVSMDMEGSEYDVLDHLIKSNKLQMINEIYVEFHTRKLRNDETQRESRLIEVMNETIGESNVYIFNGQNHDQFIKLVEN